MEPDYYKVVGVMSGTSLDGLDIALVHIIQFNGHWNYVLKGCKNVSYSKEWYHKLQGAVQITSDKLINLDREYGTYIGTCINEFLTENDFEADLIASHGHTVFHQPTNGFTLQIGNGQNIATKTNIATVADFRSKDVAYGGQGAPLVPVGDEFFFSKYEACINLGGISNISFKKNHNRMAYDVGIANMALNYLAGKEGKSFDANGNMAKQGAVNPILFDALNRIPYYALSAPKSTGFEWFEAEVQPVLDNYPIPIIDKLATCVEHIAFQVGKAISYALGNKGSVIITGGGALNTFLIHRVSYYIPHNVQLTIPDNETINYKEAVIFALMGVLRWTAQPNCLASVTGASKDVSGGVIYLP